MKKIIFTGLLGIGMMFSANAQLKVVASGDTEVKKTLFVGENAGTGQSAVRVGLNRTAAGTAMFDFFTQPSANIGSFQLRLSSEGASSNFSHTTNGPFRFKSTSLGPIQFSTSNIVRMNILANGQVDILGAATVNGGMAVTSDRRLKQNVRPLDRGLTELMQFEPVVYQYNGKGHTTAGDEHVGLIAQDLQKIAPEFVSSHQITDYDELGNITLQEEYLKIHDTELKYVMVKAIQDQQHIIEEKEVRISDLESRLKDLEAKVGQLANVYDVSLGGPLPDAGSLNQNIPNPFTNETRIAYSIPEKASSSKMNIYDLNGHLLKTIEIDHIGKGIINLSADFLPSGGYSYQLVVDNKIVGAKKMILAK